MPRRDDSAERQALAEVREIYADLARRPLVRSCTLRTECCQFQLTGKVPHLTKGEALVAARGFQATGRKELPVRSDGACPLLHPKTQRCLIYEARPFGCRTHFCAAAGGPVARREVADLIRRLEDIGARLGDPGPRQLEPALRDALEK